MITQERLKELVRYDEETGHLTWNRKSGDKHNNFNSRFADKRAGCVHYVRNYAKRYVRLDGILYLEHRMVYLYMTGGMPDMIDHINKDATDNRWCNLRASDYEGNSLNKTTRSDNKHGHPGVHWHSIRKKWTAAGYKGYKKIHLGTFDTIEEAVSASQAFRRENGYT